MLVNRKGDNWFVRSRRRCILWRKRKQKKDRKIDGKIEEKRSEERRRRDEERSSSENGDSATDNKRNIREREIIDVSPRTF